MRIIFLDWNCFDKEETKEAFKNLGHEVYPFIHDDYNADVSEDFDRSFKELAEKKNIDMVFSYNFYPVVALACRDLKLPYVSFLYDSPYAYIYSYTLAFPTNHVFLFDSSLTEYFRKGGLENVHYMVLPGVPDKIDRMLKKDFDRKRMSSDVSFVGALYNEAHNFYDRIDFKNAPYLDGYLRGVMDAQKKVAGYNFVEELLTPEILSSLQETFPVDRGERSIETEGFRYADYFINRKISSEERIEFITALGSRFGSEYTVKLFTLDKSFSVPGVKNMGVAEYDTEMPYVFNQSRINLNISLRSIKTGIPLRCMDIMGFGGFLLTNYQADLFHDFIPGEDFDFYESKDDMLDKVEYYLSHEKERAEIAANGQQKVREYFTIEAVLTRIMDIVFERN
ncbi:MAG: glycosyltransferase [Lachnospiraceae bacterium]|nr:glycosyltransferase [Lachnospiraceae bacterium]